MRLAATPDQLALRSAVSALLDKECPPESLRAAWDSATGRVPALWARLADLGVTGLVVAEEHGGLGLGDVELAIVLEEVGRHAVPESVLPTMVGAGLLTGAAAAEWLPKVADGSAVVAVSLRDGPVAGAQDADLLVLSDGEDVYAVPRGSTTVIAEPSVDPAARFGRVEWSPSEALRLVDADVARAADRGALGAAAQLLGLAQGLLDQAVAYAQQREQFGRAIGSFQAVKHQLADTYVAVEFTRPVIARASWSMDPADVSHAKVAAIAAARRAARVSLQVHGAIGYTYEHDLHMWLKRVWTLTPAWGDEPCHLARIAATIGV